VKEHPLTLHGRESIIGHNGIVGEIRSSWEREEIYNDPGTVRDVGVDSVGVECEGIVVDRAF